MIARKKAAILQVFLLLFFAASPAFSQVSDDKFARILKKTQAKLDDLHASLQFPGATVGFVLPDGRAGSISTGVTARETKTLLKTTDLILAGSIGKTFVAAEALILVEENKLSLDDKIERWLGAKKWFSQLPNARDITLRMLLNHSSGIPNHVEYKNFFKDAVKNAGTDIKYEDLLNYVLDKKPLFAAGKGYYYADTNYILVGLIVEKVTGKTLYDEVTRRFLKPLALDHTIPSTDASLLLAVNGYYEGKPMITKGKFMINPQWEWTGGGFASTSEDLARWAKALYGGDVLQKRSMDEMLGSTTTAGEGKNYGLGVEIHSGKFGRAVGHDGEYPGFLSNMRYFPQYKIAVAAQINDDGTPAANKFVDAAIDDFAQIIIEELVGDKLSVAEKLQFQKKAEAWLKLVTAGKYPESWDDISDELKAKYARDRWQTALEPFAKEAGRLKSRKFKSVVYSDEKTVAVDFESSFSKIPEAIETVIFTLEKDGQWRVATYSIK